MTTCSGLWSDAALPALGSAPFSRFWLALEQNGAWGAKALVESDLDVAVGQRLADLCAEHGGNAVLIRQPGDHKDVEGEPRRVLLSGGPFDNPWIGTTTVDDPADLVQLFESWVGGDLDVMPEWLEPEGHVLLVCTNGKRDRCCAIKGRPIANALAAQEEFSDRVWESSHLHGHRFATTALALPMAQMFARLDEALGRRILNEGTPLPVGEFHDRGRTLLSAPLQVADVVVRNELHATDQSSLEYTGPDADGIVEVLNRTDRRTWRVRVEQREVGDPLPKSCGKDSEPVVVWSGTIL